MVGTVMPCLTRTRLDGDADGCINVLGKRSGDRCQWIGRSSRLAPFPRFGRRGRRHHPQNVYPRGCHGGRGFVARVYCGGFDGIRSHYDESESCGCGGADGDGAGA
jgi:hypothetical protein